MQLEGVLPPLVKHTRSVKRHFLKPHCSANSSFSSPADSSRSLGKNLPLHSERNYIDREERYRKEIERKKRSIAEIKKYSENPRVGRTLDRWNEQRLEADNVSMSNKERRQWANTHVDPCLAVADIGSVQRQYPTDSQY